MNEITSDSDGACNFVQQKHFYFDKTYKIHVAYSMPRNANMKREKHDRLNYTFIAKRALILYFCVGKKSGNKKIKTGIGSRRGAPPLFESRRCLNECGKIAAFVKY